MEKVDSSVETGRTVQKAWKYCSDNFIRPLERTGKRISKAKRLSLYACKCRVFTDGKGHCFKGCHRQYFHVGHKVDVKW
jgi:hypothetical protein